MGRTDRQIDLLVSSIFFHKKYLLTSIFFHEAQILFSKVNKSSCNIWNNGLSEGNVGINHTKQHSSTFEEGGTSK